MTMTVPTPDEDALVDTLEDVQASETAPCRLCDAQIDVSDATNWGDVFEALAAHGVEEHNLPEDEPWSNEMLSERM